MNGQHCSRSPQVRELLTANAPVVGRESRDVLAVSELRVPVEGGWLRVLHHRPAGADSQDSCGRPVVFVPGWGAVYETFEDFHAVLAGRVELYQVETREKSSSVLHDRTPDFSVDRSVDDLVRVLDYLGLNGTGSPDFVLVGACWGASLILEGLIAEALRAPSVVAFEPMHSMWFPRWVLRYVSPLLPIPILGLAKWLVAAMALAGMREERQRARVNAMIAAADVAKWKRAAEAAADFELLGRLAPVEREVFIVSGSGDKIHDGSWYPRLAGELPGGRYFTVPVSESERETLLGAVAAEFALAAVRTEVPPRVSCFEQVRTQGNEDHAGSRSQ